MAKSKSKSTHVFEVRMWSKEYYGEKRNYNHDNIYNGLVVNKKTGETNHFHSPAELLEIIEKQYAEGEKQ